jgi:hypothetical protein
MTSATVKGNTVNVNMLERDGAGAVKANNIVEP